MTGSISSQSTRSSSSSSRNKLRGTRKKRRATAVVRFADDENLSNSIHNMINYDQNIVDPSLIWYNQEEYTRMKDKSKSDANSKRQQGYSVLVRNTYLAPKSNVQNCLNALCCLAPEDSQRGLERYMSRQHFQERSALKNRSRNGLLDQQRQLRKQEFISPEELEQALFEMYSTTCLAAHDFARRLAIADELAAALPQGCDPTLARKVFGNSSRPSLQRQVSNLSLHSKSSVDSLLQRKQRQLEIRQQQQQRAIMLRRQQLPQLPPLPQQQQAPQATNSPPLRTSPPPPPPPPPRTAPVFTGVAGIA